MANLSSFTGGGVKNVQRGTVSLSHNSFADPPGSFNATVTISAVVTSKSVLLMSVLANFSIPYDTGGSGSTITSAAALGSITSSTTLYFQMGGGGTYANGANNYGAFSSATINWQVIEYY